MREIVLRYIKNPTKELESKLTSMELNWAKKQVPRKGKPEGQMIRRNEQQAYRSNGRGSKKRGLAWRKEYNRGRTSVGVAPGPGHFEPGDAFRQNNFADKFLFSRHEVDKKGQRLHTWSRRLPERRPDCLGSLGRRPGPELGTH